MKPLLLIPVKRWTPRMVKLE